MVLMVNGVPWSLGTCVTDLVMLMLSSCDLLIHHTPHCCRKPNMFFLPHIVIVISYFGISSLLTSLVCTCTWPQVSYYMTHTNIAWLSRQVASWKLQEASWLPTGEFGPFNPLPHAGKPLFQCAVGMKPRCLKANNPFIHDSLWSVELNSLGY